MAIDVWLWITWLFRPAGPPNGMCVGPGRPIGVEVMGMPQAGAVTPVRYGGGRACKGYGPAAAVGKRIAERAKQLGIERVAFDRSGFRFHGRVKALAEAARESGLKF